jgi:hypothetical protein
VPFDAAPCFIVQRAFRFVRSACPLVRAVRAHLVAFWLCRCDRLRLFCIYQSQGGKVFPLDSRREVWKFGVSPKGVCQFHGRVEVRFFDRLFQTLSNGFTVHPRRLVCGEVRVTGNANRFDVHRHG